MMCFFLEIDPLCVYMCLLKPLHQIWPSKHQQQDVTSQEEHEEGWRRAVDKLMPNLFQYDSWLVVLIIFYFSYVPYISPLWKG